MHRPGADLDAMLPSDILHDFRGGFGSEDVSTVGGHRGSCIRGGCLAADWQTSINAEIEDAPPPVLEGTAPSWKSTLGHEAPEDQAGRRSIREEAIAGGRCIPPAAGALGTDPDVERQRSLPGPLSRPGPARHSTSDSRP